MTVSDEFQPLNVCRGCNQPTPQCHCGRSVRCPVCNGRGFNCWDDICRGRGRCMHGDSCARCHGEGAVPPEQVLVVPDETAAAVRDYAREHPELQHDDYATGDDVDPLLGLCYPVAEAYYHLRGPDGYHAYCLNWADVDDDYEGTHWYLRDVEREQWVDIALPTMPPVDLPPFESGTRQGGFITGNEPSGRAQQIIDAVGGGETA